MSVVRHQSMVLVLMQLSNLNSGGAQPNRMTYTNPAKVGKVGRLGTLSLTRAFPFTSMKTTSQPCPAVRQTIIHCWMRTRQLN
jgi:hypothetical protein